MKVVNGGNVIVFFQTIKLIVGIIIACVLAWIGYRVYRFMKTGNAGGGMVGDLIKYSPLGITMGAVKTGGKLLKKTGDAYKKHRARKKSRRDARKADRAACDKYKGFKKFGCKAKANLKKRR